MCGGSPLCRFCCRCIVLLFKMSGRIYRRGDVFFNSRSPLCLFCFVCAGFIVSRCRGDTQGRDVLLLLSFSPLFCGLLVLFCIVSYRGDYTG